MRNAERSDKRALESSRTEAGVERPIVSRSRPQRCEDLTSSSGAPATAGPPAAPATVSSLVALGTVATRLNLLRVRSRRKP